MQDIRIYVAVRDSGSRKNLKEMITRQGNIVTGDSGDGSIAMKQIRELQPEIVIAGINLPLMNGFELARIIAEDRVAAVVLIGSYTDGPNMREKVGANVPVLFWPLDECNFISLLEYTLHNFNWQNQIEKEVSRLKGELEARKTTEKAKGILMKRLGLTEEEAFKKMQLQSMNNRTSMKKIAEAIILTYGIV